MQHSPNVNDFTQRSCWLVICVYQLLLRRFSRSTLVNHLVLCKEQDPIFIIDADSLILAISHASKRKSIKWFTIRSSLRQQAMMKQCVIMHNENEKNIEIKEIQ